MNNTFLSVVERYQAAYNFNQPLGTLTKANLIFQFGKYFKSKELQNSLKDCPTLTRMIIRIGHETDELTKPRDHDQMIAFENQVVKILTFAKINRL